MKILILDKRVNRAKYYKKKLLNYDNDLTVIAVESISKFEFENNGFDIVIVHKGNSEFEDIDEEVWDFNGKRFYFSGSWSAYYEREDGVVLSPAEEIISYVKKWINKK